MSCKESLRTQSFTDGELQGAAADEAERHIETCADCQALVADIADVSDVLRGTIRHRAPTALRARVAMALDRETARRPARNFWAGAASGGGITALAAGLVVFALLPPSAASLTTSVVDAHGRALVSGHTIMVASSDHHTVKPWLAAHAALSPPAVDFSGQGFALVGGRTDEVAGGGHGLSPRQS
jgi:anti-sigma factor RsiW